MWLRFPCTVRRNPFGVPFGTLTFRNVRSGSGCSQHQLGQLRRGAWPTGRSRRRSRACAAATPQSPECRAAPPSRAPATVPEYVTSSPRFQPVLMPDTTRSGSSPFEEDGDAEVDAVGRRAVDRVEAVAHLLDAQRPPQRQRMADGARFLRCGATTVTSPSGVSAAASARMPSEWTPSSLVTRIRGIGTTIYRTPSDGVPHARRRDPRHRLPTIIPRRWNGGCGWPAGWCCWSSSW